MPVRVRIAPSPTGDPHVGTAYIALFNYCFARKHGGQFLLRIEDTDRERSTRESEEAILRALKWVGLTWDEGPDVGGPFGPYRQSERAAIYREHAQILLDKGAAYRCFCTPARLAELKEQQKAAKQNPGYDGLCRNVSDGDSKRRAASEPFVVRLKMPPSSPPVKDRLRGVVEKTEQLDDQVLLKSDGFPTYHLANVVDDHLMQITHVIRAEEWISSTPKHIVLYDAFGWTAPEWIHMPLLRNDDKSKISKRKHPVSLDYYRDTGFLPEALLNFLGNMGYSVGENKEKFPLGDMIETFDIDRVKLGGPVFDLKKLAHLNQQYLAAMTDAELVGRLRTWRFTDEMLTKIAAFLKPRMQTLAEFAPQATFFLTGDLTYGPDLAAKGKTPAESAKALAALLEDLDALRTWKKDDLERIGRAQAEKLTWKAGDLFMLIRVAITGSTMSPGLFESMELVGKDLSRRRIRQAIEVLNRTK